MEYFTLNIVNNYLIKKHYNLKVIICISWHGTCITFKESVGFGNLRLLRPGNGRGVEAKMSRQEIGLGSGPVYLAPESRRSGLSEFELRLNQYTKVPLDRLEEFLDWSDERVKQETQIVNRVLRRFAEAVVNSMESPSSAGEFLQALDLKLVSRDHDWRAVFSTIKAQESEFDDYKRALLVKYLQYLSFRKRLLEFIYSRRRSLEQTEELPGIYLGSGASDIDLGRAADRLEEAPEGYLRLPLGESREVRLPINRETNLMLANHAFRLMGGEPPAMVDQNGVTYFLRPGRNMVGRHPESDVRVDQNFSDVSRAHCLLEWRGGDLLILTDLSSRGTFVKRKGV